ncbi:tetratricopeptide repeat-containing sensor histidine kinase [Epilithonimonas arachidiradicis]|uniref:Tetratricopeptide repeat protein n=2 Tax=Epilithonimonas arachidiradicis TaxID=1617282 RepID=A0A420DE48_9FLAO|nr:tetratricopeptide repeat protein [Epilithonimonas arachidiradicis]RKE90053.1 tetratricopeptide repeat protein [Epilithonimonas arachidiradicis]
MRKILLFLMLIPAIWISAQSAVDSLLTVLKKEKNPNQITALQNQISDAYKHSDPEQMQKFALLALTNSRKNKNVYQESVAYQNIGVSFFIHGDYEKALQNLDSSEKILLKINSEKKEIRETLAKTLGSKGVVYSQQNNYAAALENDFRALKIYEETKNNLQASKLYNNIGVIYKSIDDQEKALEYFLKANQTSKKINPETFAASASNIGLIYLFQNKLDQAKKYFDESLKSYQENENPRGLGELYNSYSQYYIRKNQKQAAKNSLQKAEEVFLSIDDKFGLSDTYMFLARIYLGENDLEKSLQFSNKSLELAKELDLTEARMNAEKLLSQIYDQKEDQKLALYHLKNYDIEKEKFDAVKNEQQRLNTELNFQYEKQQLEKRENASRERLKWIFTVLIIGLLLLGLFLFYRNKEKQKTLLLQKQLTEFEHKALHLQMNPHFVFNCLAAISAFVVQNGKDEAIRYLAKFSKLMRLTLEFSKESSITLDKEIEALQNYLELEQLRFNNKFDFNISKESNIEDDTAIPSLLLQPYVENAIIHGVVPLEDKGFINIIFRQIEDQLICIITDNGVGIEQSKKKKETFVNAHKSMAMEISKKRLETLEQLENKKIELSITELRDNEKILGTQVLIKLPLEFIEK